MKKPGSCILYFAALLATAYRCHSLGEFLVAGLGTVLLLDRYLLRCLPWTPIASWTKEVLIRFGIFVTATAAIYLVRLGSVPVAEALSLGTAAMFVLFLAECGVGAATRMIARLGGGLGAKPLLWLVSLGFLILAAPLEAIHPLHTVPRRTPTAQGLEFEDIRIPTSDGIELAGWLVPHQEARGNVIFCHGHGRNRGHASWILPTLHALRLNVLAFDFRGHGDSPGHTSTFGHEEVRDLLAAVEYLDRRCPDQPLFIIGVSLGAAVTLQALPELPNVRGVWSEGCFSRLSTAMDHYFSVIPTGPREPLLAGYNYVAWLDCGLWPPDINPQEALGRTRVPICFCHGQKDELVPFAEAEALYECYEGPKWHYWVPDGNHYNLRQVAREDYLERLRGFFEERLGGY